MRRAAEWIVAELTRIGFEQRRGLRTAGHPVVYADWLHAPGAPTILVYCHYDVQPVDPIDLWETAPFDPFVRDGRMVGRGAADDKGQLHMHLRAAEALLATRGRLPLNLRIVFEGEEESTSANLPGWLEANRAPPRLRTPWSSATRASSRATCRRSRRRLRGMLYTQIDVVGAPVDLHSGGFGGAVENPANALARIITELKGRDGTVRVPGFYDDVVELDRAGALRAQLPALRRGGLPGDRRRAGARRPGAGLPAARSAGRSARRSTSTASGAASPARAPRRSSRRTPTPRSAAARARPGRREAVRAVPRLRPVGRPPGVTVEVQNLGTAKAAPDRHRQPRVEGGGARA